MKLPIATFLTAVVFVTLLDGHLGDAEVTCPDNYKCPEYTVTQSNEDFEERVYAQTRWITTDVPTSSKADINAGFTKLIDYSHGYNEEHKPVNMDTWPVLVSITEADDGKETDVSVSFYVTSDTELPKFTDTSIREKIIPAGTVYARNFGGFPTHSAAQANSKLLRETLRRVGLTFDTHTYTGAGYDSPWKLFYRHNEVLLHAALE